MNILVVDDSSTMQMFIKVTLNELGYHDVQTCDSAKAALETIDKSHPDLILLDWHMPEMNGLELLQELKNSDKTKQIPVIMLTTESATENVAKAIENGAEGYVLKPINKELLKTRLEDIKLKRTFSLKK